MSFSFRGLRQFCVVLWNLAWFHSISLHGNRQMFCCHFSSQKYTANYTRYGDQYNDEGTSLYCGGLNGVITYRHRDIHKIINSGQNLISRVMQKTSQLKNYFPAILKLFTEKSCVTENRLFRKSITQMGLGSRCFNDALRIINTPPPPILNVFEIKNMSIKHMEATKPSICGFEKTSGK